MATVLVAAEIISIRRENTMPDKASGSNKYYPEGLDIRRWVRGASRPSTLPHHWP